MRNYAQERKKEEALDKFPSEPAMCLPKIIGFVVLKNGYLFYKKKIFPIDLPGNRNIPQRVVIKKEEKVEK